MGSTEVSLIVTRYAVAQVFPYPAWLSRDAPDLWHIPLIYESSAIRAHVNTAGSIVQQQPTYPSVRIPNTVNSHGAEHSVEPVRSALRSDSIWSSSGQTVRSQIFDL